VLGVLDPGSHGSTFGGNPLACAVAREVVAMLATGEPQAAARALGAQLERLVGALPVRAARTRGAWAGLDVDGRSGRDVCDALLERGVVAKETHGATLRLAPPLTTDAADLAWAIDQLAEVLTHG
jgi:ornithine--oxo-acid transaminase